MGKPELNLHLDPDLLAQAQAAGVAIERVAESAIRLALVKADPAAAVLVTGQRWSPSRSTRVRTTCGSCVRTIG